MIASLVLNIALLIIAIGFVIFGIASLPNASALLPLVFGGLGTIAGVWEIVRVSVRSSRMGNDPETVIGHQFELEMFNDEVTKVLTRRTLVFFGWFFAGFTAILLFGFVVSVPIMVSAYLILMPPRIPAHYAVLAGASFFVLLRFGIEGVLKIPLP